jgi:hypothetical protein
VGIELESETRILVGRLREPANPDMPWWWQASTTIDGAELIVAGFARTEPEAILEAAASTIDLRWHDDIPAARKPAPDSDRRHEPGWWPGPNDPV